VAEGDEAMKQSGRARATTGGASEARAGVRAVAHQALGRGGVGLLVAVLALAGCDSPERREARVARNLYEANCATCHGSHRKGEGPQIVPGTDRRAPDLRTLARRWGDPLPRERVAAMIDGREEVAAHGPRPMPVWGDRLYRDWPESQNREQARAGTIDLLVDYIESVQEP
jgi:mono/diheme cytochrome c family protein